MVFFHGFFSWFFRLYFCRSEISDRPPSSAEHSGPRRQNTVAHQHSRHHTGHFQPDPSPFRNQRPSLRKTNVYSRGRVFGLCPMGRWASCARPFSSGQISTRPRRWPLVRHLPILFSSLWSIESHLKISPFHSTLFAGFTLTNRKFFSTQLSNL